MITRDGLREAVSDQICRSTCTIICSCDGTNDCSTLADRIIRLVVEWCAVVADERAAICQDAVEKIVAGTLYRGRANAKETEQCARLEALHIARLIRELSAKEPSP